MRHNTDPRIASVNANVNAQKFFVYGTIPAKLLIN